MYGGGGGGGEDAGADRFVTGESEGRSQDISLRAIWLRGIIPVPLTAVNRRLRRTEIESYRSNGQDSIIRPFFALRILAPTTNVRLSIYLFLNLLCCSYRESFIVLCN